MYASAMFLRLIVLLGIALFAGVLFLSEAIKDITLPIVHIGSVAVASLFDSPQRESIGYVGDIQLARAVESYMEKRGREYPFLGIEQLFPEPIPLVGNFEGTVQKNHQQTKDFNMQFSVRTEYLYNLKKHGFTHLSLANNHAFDFGEAAYLYTLDQCKEADIVCFGHPERLSTQSVTYVSAGDTRVGVIAIHTLTGSLSELALGMALQEANMLSDIQVAFVHWGVEYELQHAREQETFAHMLIDAGVDAVIGHHPHVTEDIGLYKNTPIFYSLGNFIFDQYFNDEVQEGFVLVQHIFNSHIEYEIRPITSTASPSQPRVMEGEARTQFLKNLAQRSDPTLAASIIEGTIVVPR